MSPNHPIAKVAESKGQNNWVDEKLPDLKTLARELRAQAIEELAPPDSHDAAIELAAQHLGLSREDASRVIVKSPMGDILIQRSLAASITSSKSDKTPGNAM